MENRELRLKWRKERDRKGFWNREGSELKKEGRQRGKEEGKKVNGVREFRELKWES